MRCIYQPTLAVRNLLHQVTIPRVREFGQPELASFAGRDDSPAGDFGLPGRVRQTLPAEEGKPDFSVHRLAETFAHRRILPAIIPVADVSRAVVFLVMPVEINVAAMSDSFATIILNSSQNRDVHEQLQNRPFFDMPGYVFDHSGLGNRSHVPAAV
jgi:hypothetical protein